MRTLLSQLFFVEAVSQILATWAKIGMRLVYQYITSLIISNIIVSFHKIISNHVLFFEILCLFMYGTLYSMYNGRKFRNILWREMRKKKALNLIAES